METVTMNVNGMTCGGCVASVTRVLKAVPGVESVDVTLKLTAEEREIAHLLPYVRTASHVGRYGWVTAAVTDEESLESALEWLRESYWLKCPSELKAAVEGDD